LLQSRSNKTRVLAIILCVLGVIIFIFSMISIIQSIEFYVGGIYASVFTYILGIIFGRVGWGIHFGITLILIGLYLLKERKIGVDSEESLMETKDAVLIESPNRISVLEWFGILILLNIPLVNLILLLIWAFDADNPKKNFSRAILLYFAVVIVVVIVIVIATASSQMY
jgi:hypothetical protein